MSVPLELASGKRARLMALDGERVSLLSEEAFAPGARVEASGRGLRLRFKVHRCVRGDDGFAIEGRPIDLTRVNREALAAALASSKE